MNLSTHFGCQLKKIIGTGAYHPNFTVLYIILTAVYILS